jgi:hypothetical protein
MIMEPATPTAAAQAPRKDDSALLRQLSDWWYDARDRHSQNRAEQATDAAFYDHEQYTAEEIAEMHARFQAPLVFNKVKIATDWLLGTERRSRLDWNIRPRGPQDTEPAKAKQAFMKYLDDVNGFSWERSRAFEDQVKVGIGWTDETVTTDPNDPPVLCEHESWRNVWLDPHSRHLQLKDARYIHRRRTLDVEYAVAMFPEHEALIQSAANIEGRLGFDIDDEMSDEDVPQLWLRADEFGRTRVSRNWAGIAPYGLRMRVTIIETQFRKPVAAKRITARDGGNHGQWFDPSNPDLVKLYQDGAISLSDTIRQQIHYALWVPNGVLRSDKMPMRHDRFSLTPYWGFRRDRDGMPYGVIRGVRDAQSDFNKRMSKAQFHLAANQVIGDEDAVNDWDDVADNAARPDGIIKLNSAKNGAGSKRFEILRGEALAAGQVNLAEVASAHIHDGTGVNREQLGRDTNAQSGRAIQAKQSEGALTTAALFDNYRLAFKISGQKVLSLAEQYCTGPMQFRITENQHSIDWMEINTPVFDETTGEWTYHNDITAQQADFVVDAQDYRETMRLAMAEQLMETIGQLDPQIGLQLLDLAIDLTDLPGKDVIVKRIRELNGHADPGSENDPEQQAKRQQKEQAAAEEQAMVQRERGANVTYTEAQAKKLLADAESQRVDTQGKALTTAQLIAQMLPFAPTADQVIANANQQPGAI